MPLKEASAREPIACAALLVAPFQGSPLAALLPASDSVLVLVLAISVCILGFSAAVLYRLMHQREEELRRRAENSEAELRALLMMTDEAVLVLSHDGKVRAANPAAEELFDRDAADFVGEALSEVIAQPLALGELTKHGPVNFETTAKRGEDGFAQVEMLLSPVELSGGRGYLALIHENRATSTDEASKGGKRKADFQKAIEKFSHDLNNQLTSVLGNLSLILMARPGDPATHERVLNAKKTAVRAQALNQELQSLVSPEGDGQNAAPDAAMTCTILPMPNMKAPARTQPTPRSGPTRILILDDEEAICLLVATALDASGFEVTPATSVATALRVCEEAVQAGEPYSLVICDLSLPGEVNGMQALQQLRVIDPGIRAIVSSGYESDPVMRECRKYGFNGAMAKPYDINKLVRKVGEVLAGDGEKLRKTA